MEPGVQNEHGTGKVVVVHGEGKRKRKNGEEMRELRVLICLGQRACDEKGCGGVGNADCMGNGSGTSLGSVVVDGARAHQTQGDLCVHR